MNRNHFSVITFLLFSCSSIFAQESAWETFSSGIESELSFSVEAPGEFEFFNDEAETDLGYVYVTSYSLKGSKLDPNKLYLINVLQYEDNPFETLDSTEQLTFVDDFVNSLLQSVEMKLDYSTDLEESSNLPDMIAGKKYRMSDDSNVINGKVILIDDFILSLQVFTAKKNALNDAKNTFLNNILVLDQKED